MSHVRKLQSIDALDYAVRGKQLSLNNRHLQWRDVSLHTTDHVLEGYRHFQINTLDHTSSIAGLQLTGASLNGFDDCINGYNLCISLHGTTHYIIHIPMYPHGTSGNWLNTYCKIPCISPGHI